jgi:hypothetical protein
MRSAPPAPWPDFLVEMTFVVLQFAALRLCGFAALQLAETEAETEAEAVAATPITSIEVMEIIRDEQS